MSTPTGSAPHESWDRDGAFGRADNWQGDHWHGERQPERRWSPGVILDILRRRFRLVAAITGGILLLAMLYIAVAEPKFTATVALITDVQRAPLSPTDPAQEGQIDPALIESQLETIRSDKVALAVVEKLSLWHDPEFVPEKPGFIERTLLGLGLAEAKPPLTEEVKRRVAVAHMRQNLKVLRAGRSLVAEISFTSPDPVKAALVANEVAAAYLADQTASQLDNAQRNSAWMQQRVESLRRQASTSLRELEDYKLSSNTVTDPQSNLARLARIRELEVSAQAYKTIFEAFLNRYTQTLQEQAFPATGARVVTRASPPLEASAPRTGVILLLALVAGCLMGVAGALVRDVTDRIIRRPEQVSQALGLRVLGALPRLTGRGLFRKRKRPRTLRTGPLQPMSDGFQFFRGYGYGEADSLRTIKLAIDRAASTMEGRVIGIVSARAGEGKTLLATNLAAASAECGERALVIEANLRNPSLGAALDGDAAGGLLDLLRGAGDIPSLVTRHPRGFDVLSALQHDATKHPADVLGSPPMRALINQCRKHYDVILVDTAPMEHAADVLAIAPHIDHFVLVAESGRTSLDDLAVALARSADVAERVIGLVLNKTRPSVPAAPDMPIRSSGSVVPLDLRRPPREPIGMAVADGRAGP